MFAHWLFLMRWNITVNSHPPWRQDWQFETISRSPLRKIHFVTFFFHKLQTLTTTSERCYRSQKRWIQDKEFLMDRKRRFLVTRTLSGSNELFLLVFLIQCWGRNFLSEKIYIFSLELQLIFSWIKTQSLRFSVNFGWGAPYIPFETASVAGAQSQRFWSLMRGSKVRKVPEACVKKAFQRRSFSRPRIFLGVFVNWKAM